MPQPTERIEFSCTCQKSYSLPIREVLFNAPFRCQCGRNLVVSSEVIGIQSDKPVRYLSAGSQAQLRRTA